MIADDLKSQFLVIASEAKQSIASASRVDCFVASLLAMTTGLTQHVGWVERSETHLFPLQHHDGFHFFKPSYDPSLASHLPAQQLAITVKSVVDASCAQGTPHHRRCRGD